MHNAVAGEELRMVQKSRHLDWNERKAEGAWVSLCCSCWWALTGLGSGAWMRSRVQGCESVMALCDTQLDVVMMLISF